MNQLSDKVALVTGASSGLGAATAQVFADRGASVFGIARDGGRMASVFETVPRQVRLHRHRRSGGLPTAVDQCIAEFGRLMCW